jgi:hypothetical protein
VSNKIIRKLFDSRMATWGDTNDYAISIENKHFDPAKDAKEGKYFETVLLPANTVSDDLAGAHRGYRGVYQIDIVMKKRVGTGVTDTVVNELDALFPNNLRLTDVETGFVVQVMTPVTAGPGLAGARGYVVPVSFNYRSDKA